jgi:hypothetical protein
MALMVDTGVPAVNVTIIAVPSHCGQQKTEA